MTPVSGVLRSDPVETAAEVIAVMGGYACGGQPRRFGASRGSPCPGRARCEDHSYLRAEVSQMPQELLHMTPWDMQEVFELGALAWLLEAERRETENRSRLLVLMRVTHALRGALSSPGDKELVLRMGLEIKRFLAEEWAVPEVPRDPSAIGAVAEQVSRAREIPRAWRRWKPSKPIGKDEFRRAEKSA